MTGISEILVLILLICGILIIPRMMKPAPARKAPARKKGGLTFGMRAGIVVSLLIPIVSGLVIRPWSGNILLFVVTGILPVALAWGIFWVLSARKH